MTIGPALCSLHKITPKPRWRWVNLIAVLLCLLGPSVPVRGQESGDPAAPKPLDILLLIDSSPSSRETDPQGLRINTSKFLLDYLQATAQVLRVNYRAGVANFGGRMGATTPLRLLEAGIVQGAIVSETISYTDFRPPLDWALRELRARSFGVGNQMAVILFTDGNPQLSTQPLTVEQKESYFAGQPLAGDASELTLPGLVQEMKDAGVAVFVVGIGDARQDSKFWQNLVGAENYRSLDDVANLPTIYHEFAVRLLGAVARPLRSLQPADSPLREAAPPYLEQMIFSFVKEKPAVQVTLTDPAGQSYLPTAGGKTGDLHQIYAIANPKQGDWQITVSGGDAQLWVDQRLSHLLMDGPQGPQILRQPIPLTARLVRNGEVIADNNLQIGIEVTLPGMGGVVEQTLTPAGDGLFRASFVPEAAGVYTVTATTRLSGQPLAVDNPPLVLSAYPAPSIAQFQIQGEAAPGQTVVLKARLNDADRLASGQPVEVALFDQDNVNLGTVRLHDDGRSPDQQAGDGIYSADLTISPALSAVELVIAGRTIDGVAFSLRERYSLAQAMVTTTPATVVATPSPDTHTPTVSSATPPTPTADRTPTPTTGDKSGIEGGDWGWLLLALAAGAAVAGGILLWRVINPGALRLRQVEQSLAAEQQHLADERIEHEKTGTEYDATKDQLNREQSNRKNAEDELKREKEAHESTKGQWQQEKESYERTRGQWQQEKEEHERTKHEWSKARQEWEQQAEALQKDAQSAFKHGNQELGREKLEQAIKVASDASENTEERAAGIIARYLEELLRQGYEGMENQSGKRWERLKSEIAESDTPARVHGVAIVLKQRWEAEPKSIPTELNEVLCLKGSYPVIEKMKKLLKPSQSRSHSMLYSIMSCY